MKNLITIFAALTISHSRNISFYISSRSRYCRYFRSIQFCRLRCCIRESYFQNKWQYKCHSNIWCRR